MSPWIDWRFESEFLVELNGYVRTYADEHYGRIRGPNREDRIGPGVVFLILFGCAIGGFFTICIFGTVVLEMIDSGFACIERYFHR